jgi:cytochrome b6-f complex iron-sulfur subunit
VGRSGFGRRRFLAGVAAAACVGCTGGERVGGHGGERVGEGGEGRGADGGGAEAEAGAAGGPEGSTTTIAPLPGGFGGVVDAGKLAVVLEGIERGRGFLHLPEGRLYLTRVPGDAVDAALAAYDERLHEGIRAGIIATYQKCTHLGCRVPACETSGWFECPCHGARFTGIGEAIIGPAPRGLDHFPITVRGRDVDGDGVVLVDTGVVVEGMPLGTETVPHEAAGPHCA